MTAVRVAEIPFASYPRLSGLTLTELSTYKFSPRRALLCREGIPVFREGHLGQVYAERGIGKTWFVNTLALVVASGVSAIGFSCPEPRRVVLVDGEMAGEEIQDRLLRLARSLYVPLDSNLTVVAADWQDDFLPRVDTAEGQAALEPFVRSADLVVFDNRSCLFDAESEKDPAAWMPAQEYLLSLRRRGKGVLVAHHANRQGGARGHSKSEDVFNLLLKLSRPEGYAAPQGARFTVTFDKARGICGDALDDITTRLTESGWDIETTSPDHDPTEQKLREYLAAADAARERPKTATAAIQGAKVKKQTGLEAWGRLLSRGAIGKDDAGGFFLVGRGDDGD